MSERFVESPARQTIRPGFLPMPEVELNTPVPLSVAQIRESLPRPVIKLRNPSEANGRLPRIQGVNPRAAGRRQR